MFGRPMATAEVEQLWICYAAGETAAVVARRLGRPFPTINDRIREAGGVRPVIPKAVERSLSLAEPEEISRGLAVGDRCGASPRGWDRLWPRERGGRQTQGPVPSQP